MLSSPREAKSKEELILRGIDMDFVVKEHSRDFIGGALARAG